MDIRLQKSSNATSRGILSETIVESGNLRRRANVLSFMVTKRANKKRHNQASHNSSMSTIILHIMSLSNGWSSHKTCGFKHRDMVNSYHLELSSSLLERHRSAFIALDVLYQFLFHTEGCISRRWFTPALCPVFQSYLIVMFVVYRMYLSTDDQLPTLEKRITFL